MSMQISGILLSSILFISSCSTFPLAILSEKGNSHGVLVGKPKGKRPLGRSRCREDNIKIDLRETEWGGMDWIHVAQDK
jgi:hypothetical protein